MLNKNQSHKRNSWKYALIIPALIAFVMLFQIKVIAQEKDIIQKSQGGVYIKTDKNSSDEEMKKDAKFAKEKFGVTLKYSKVKRNREGEITGIKIEYKDKDGQKGMTQFSGDEPIEPIFFHKTRDKIGFGKPNEVHVFKNHRKNINPIITDIEDIEIPEMEDMIVDIEIPEIPNFSDNDEIPALPKAPKMIKKSIVIKKNGKDAEPEVYINGKKMDIPLADLEKMDKDFNGKFEFKGGENGPFEFKFNDDEIFKMSREDIERIKSDAMENSKIHMEKMKEHMESMRKNKSNFERDFDEGEEMQKAREEMLKAKEEMQKAREEMIKAREEMQKAKSEQLKARKA